jgi:Zn-dependent metalloprotease
MKKFLPVIFILMVSIGVAGQHSQFKQINKLPATSQKQLLKLSSINPAKLQRSSASVQPVTFRTLTFPAFNKSDKPEIIRKGNTPVFIEKKNTPLKAAASVTPEERFFRFMEDSKSITGIEKPRESFKVTSTHTDNLGITHVKSIQQYKGVEVYGSESVLHLDANKERFTGSVFTTDKEIAVNPVFSVQSSLTLVSEDLKKNTVLRELNPAEKKLLHYDAPAYSLVIYKKGNKEYALTWAITIRPNFLEEWKYFVDASNGSIINKFNNTMSDGPTSGSSVDLNNVSRTFDVYLEQGTYYLVNFSEQMYNATADEGYIMTLDANNTSTSNLNYSMVTSTDNLWSQMQAAVSAHCNAQSAYEYFLTKFGRNSLNGQGGNILSLVNVAETDGSSMENAFWNGQAVFYGNGGSHFKSLAGGLDVSAHELGHGVVSNTANLEYQGESGAINESYADIFGSMVDRDDWLIGEDVVKSAYFPSGALRSMSDPHNQGSQGDAYWQPAHYSELYTGTQDNGGVHINSGVGNRAFYLVATAVGKEKAEQIFYRALTEYLTKTSEYLDLRIAVIQSAKDLYGNSSTESVKAAEAFDTVGISNGTPDDPAGDYNTNPGAEYLLIYNTDETYTSTLYAGLTSGTQYLPFSSSEMKGKVSVTDDGSAAVYVGTDDRIYVLSLDPENPVEQALSDEQFFDNVAVSKDGLRLAAISTDVDASIYVYNFNTEVWHQFTLYNPTTSDAQIDAGGVMYADAIEFDHSGEYLVYDAYNELTSSTAEDISYWDVGYIKVWDNQTNNFGDGSISKLFTSLPENVSIGNPVFSKNSPSVIAFDYFYSDGVNEDYGIYGANLETGDLQLITSNTTLGYPTFSKNDDRIAYTFLRNDGITEDVYFVDLADDKISPATNPQLLIEYSRWPVYYATGTRDLETPVEDRTMEEIMYYPNPVSYILNIVHDGDFSVNVYNEAGQLIITAKNQHQINMSELASGLYILEISGKNGITRSKLVKQ